MNSGSDKVKNENVNVLALFSQMNEEIFIQDSVETLLEEAQIQNPEPFKTSVRVVVQENQFPEQSLFTLEEQLKTLKSNMNRIKFYLGELDDILPDKKI